MQLDRSKVRRWRKDVWRAFQREGFKPAEIMAASVLGAVITLGADVTLVSELTGLSTDYVQKVLRRLRAERVLSGQTIRAAWMDEGFDGQVGACLDAGVAAGLFSRFVDEKRSAAQKARAPETRARGPRGPRQKVQAGVPPKIQKSNPLFGLPEWKG